MYLNNRKGLLQFCREQERSRGDNQSNMTSPRKRAGQPKRTPCTRGETTPRVGGCSRSTNQEEEENKLHRVRGGCLGAEGRRRTRRPAKRSGGAACKR